MQPSHLFLLMLLKELNLAKFDSARKIIFIHPKKNVCMYLFNNIVSRNFL